MSLTQSPTNPEELREALQQGAVKFSFQKLNGDLRMASGTTNLALIPVENHPKGVRESSPKVVVFFDLAKKAWRSVSVVSLIFIK